MLNIEGVINAELCKTGDQALMHNRHIKYSVAVCNWRQLTIDPLIALHSAAARFRFYPTQLVLTRASIRTGTGQFIDFHFDLLQGSLLWIGALGSQMIECAATNVLHLGIPRKYASLRRACTGGAALALLAALFCWHGGVFGCWRTQHVAAFFFQTGTVLRPIATQHRQAGK